MSLGNSSSRTANNTTNTTSYDQRDSRIANSGDGVVIRGGGSVVDGGAIDMAGEVAGGALDLGERVADEGLSAGYDLARLNREVTQDALGFVGRAQGDALSLANDSMETTQTALGTILARERSEGAQLGEQVVKIGLPVIAAVLVARAFA